MASDSIGVLLKEAKKYYRKHGRSHLPWRKTGNPYKIMVSEVMLQQTQADRVIPYYKAFIKQFPTATSLAQADLPEVLKLWQGLGYNRRGKMLRDAARIIVERYKGNFPKAVKEMELLPGIGSYTARAISAFAYNNPEVFIETNIRTVFLYHCFQFDRHLVSIKNKTVADNDILPLVREALIRANMPIQDFYAMLMDYGSFLKKTGIRVNSRSKHYIKQSKFKGSRRQLRGQILRLLLEKPHTLTTMIYHSGRPSAEVKAELARLEKEKMVVQKNQKYFISK